VLGRWSREPLPRTLSVESSNLYGCAESPIQIKKSDVTSIWTSECYFRFSHSGPGKNRTLSGRVANRVVDYFRKVSRSQWSHGLRHGSAAARWLGLRVRISPGAWMSVCCKCCVCCQVEVSATGRSLVQRGPTERGVSECDLEALTMRWPRPIRAVEP
jgi:hypothetical protein